MLGAYVLFSLCVSLQGASIVDRQILKYKYNFKVSKFSPLNNSLNSMVSKELSTYQEPRHASRIPQNENISNSKHEIEVINLPQNDILGPPDVSVVSRIECSVDEALIREIEGYADIVQKITAHVLSGDFRGKAYDMVAELTDTFGARMTGSKQLEDSIDWIIWKSKDQNLENVHTEPVKAPHWVRNNESLHLLQPRRQELSILGLGSSVGTPPEGITAKVLVVKSFKELQDNSEKAKGNIVVFNPDWTTYLDTVPYRIHGASRAAKAGAVASLVRSITPFSINSPHTGWQHYDEQTHKIPAACIALEDAEMLQRFQDRGERIEINLYMGAQNFPDATTRNTVAEFVGRKDPEELVVLSGHLDSWDVGVGAMDDAGGSIISWMAPVILRSLDLRPRRTIRTVLFSAEEQGIRGGKAYYESHSSQKDKYQLLLESDIGTFNPLGLSFSGKTEAQCILSKILSLMTHLNATKLATPMSGGPDITMWEKAGVPTGSILNSNDRYFWFHHSAGDTMAVEDSTTLDKCAALWAAVAYVVSDLSIDLPR